MTEPQPHPHLVTLKRDPAEREADRKESVDLALEAERRHAQLAEEREKQQQLAAQAKMDEEILADGQRLAVLARGDGLKDEELDAVLAFYYEKHANRRSPAWRHEVKSTFGAVLRRALAV